MTVEAVLSSLRVELCKRNKEWCPVDSIRLNIVVDKHFTDRLVERFTNKEISVLLPKIYKWIDENYCQLLYSTNLDKQEVFKYRINCGVGSVCLALNDNTLRFRTCLKDNK
jgi:hypothetical protein